MLLRSAIFLTLLINFVTSEEQCAGACVRKCCNRGEMMDASSFKCVQGDDQFESNFESYSIIHGRDCSDNRSTALLNPKFGDIFEFELNGRGILTFQKQRFDVLDYCIEYVEQTLVAIICVTEPVQYLFHAVGKF